MSTEPLRWLLVLIVFWPTAVLAAETDWIVDDEGRRVRTGFPAHERVWIDGGWSADDGHSSSDLRAGWAFEIDADFMDEEIFWRLRHTVGEARYQAEQRVSFQLIHARYLRHDESSFVWVPGPNWKLPAPFDFAFEYELGGLEIEHGVVEEIEVLRGAVLFDFIRDPEFDSRLALGFSGAYSATPGQTWRHRISPFSTAEVVAGWDGARTLWELRGFCAFDIEAERTQWRRVCGAKTVFEVIPFAINDLPFAIRATVTVDEEDGLAGGVGLRMSIPTQ